MKAIGFRAELSGAIHWAVVEGTNKNAELVSYGTIPSPTAFSKEAVRLHHLRSQVLEKLNAHKPDSAAVRSPESRRQSHDDARLRVEGVVMEACAASNVSVVSGPIVSIGSRLKTKPANVNEYMKADEFHGVVFPKKDKKCREAITVAVSALEA
jgi:hypothetical protein